MTARASKEEAGVITHSTVFVIGAGASAPYGLPLGRGLLTNILERYKDKAGNTPKLLNTTEFTPGEVRSFVDALRYSGLQSVDAFLERRPEYLEIGKSIMGIELLQAEIHERLWQADDNWLTYLYSHMVGNSLQEFANNQVAFVTFNYDRCIEHFFFVSLKNSFGRTSEETAKIVEKIKVIHLHGRLAHLPWQKGKSSIAFGDSQIDVHKMEIVRKEIKVVHEDLTLDGRDADFDLAHVMLVNARRVYLMGFGFGARNVQRLKLDLLAPSAFDGTAYGLTAKEINDCSTLCGGKVILHHCQCLDLMRQYLALS
jgi:NAD-dependent SIR2 family protein deacetylase